MGCCKSIETEQNEILKFDHITSWGATEGKFAYQMIFLTPDNRLYMCIHAMFFEMTLPAIFEIHGIRLNEHGEGQGVLILSKFIPYVKTRVKYDRTNHRLKIIMNDNDVELY